MRDYGVLELTKTSPAQVFIEPLTLAEAKTYLRVDDISPADATEDSLISALILAAREFAETHQGRDLVEKQWDLTLDSFYDVEVQLRTPLKSVDLVRYRDSDGNYTTMVEGTDYIVDLARGLILPPPDTSWPSFTAWPSGAILVRFTCSADEIPSNVLIGMRMLIAQWYDERIPFIQNQAQELPFAITALLGYGAKNTVI